MKRGRNQRRRQGVNINRALDSNGPDVRIRGTANQIYDKYLTLARDASTSGDRVKAENYFQHAEHYFRLIRSIQPPQQAQDTANEAQAEQPTIGDSADRSRPRDNRNDGGRNENGRPDNNANKAPSDITPEESAEAKSSEDKTHDSPPNGSVEPAADSKDAEPRRQPRKRPQRRPKRTEESDADESEAKAKTDTTEVPAS